MTTAIDIHMQATILEKSCLKKVFCLKHYSGPMLLDMTATAMLAQAYSQDACQSLL